jgi:hypothetical protein
MFVVVEFLLRPYGSNLYRRHASALNLEFVLRVNAYVSAALIKCMGVLYIQIMKVLEYYYITKYTVPKSLFFRPEASGIGSVYFFKKYRHMQYMHDMMSQISGFYFFTDPPT